MSLEEHRTTRAGGNPNSPGRETCSAFLQGRPRKASAPWARRCHHGPAEAAFPHYGIAGKSVLRLYKTYYGMLRDKPKVEKEMDLGGLGINKHMSIEG